MSRPKSHRVKHSQRKRQRTRWGVAVLIGAAVLMTLGIAIHQHTAQAAGQPVLGIQDSNGSKGQFWSNPETAFYSKKSVVTDSRSFYLGDAVQLSNGLTLQVTKVERNWQPAAAVSATYGRRQAGDDPKGREVILVWFTATNQGTKAVGYSDSQWTILRVGKAEQRVAVLASLLGSDYGDRNVAPWLLPGQSKSTFVPFLVRPGEAPLSFQYYYQESGQDLLTRLSINLSSRPHAATINTTYKFHGDTRITVGQ